MKNKALFLLLVGISLTLMVNAQGYLHAENKKILDATGENVILRGIGTGNWMIQEGYMMKTPRIAATQHEYRDKLIDVIGEVRTDSFYNIWLNNHLSREDIDSMKAWGFNSIRPALHYLWFTPPIEEEPVAGEITWFETGFSLLDSLIDWCTNNEMYLILDMHGAPGGQGKNASISDYDPEKPSLWESDDNKKKLIALWQKIAERYEDEPWIGGYDLINETNWDFEDSDNENGCNCTQNIALKELFEDMIDAIRKVDTNHIIYLEGNCWANNYKGLESLSTYDNNLVYSFHKYWNYNSQEEIEWIIDIRNELNVPIWLGESGENSNTWFTNAVSLLEKNNIGWSWWPVKKTRVNNVFQVQTNEDYLYLLEYFKGNIEKPTTEQSMNALFTWADRHKAENCEVKYDVIDALLRQPHTLSTLPYKEHKANEIIYATDYDFGRNGYAYFDVDTGNYRTNTGVGARWNRGMAYRNDGVDIEACMDADKYNNGYSVFSIENGEWLQYTIVLDKTAEYSLDIRYASDSLASKLYIEVDGEIIAQNLILPITGGEYEWETVSFSEIKLPEGEHKLRLVFDNGGASLNYFSISETY